MNKSKNKSVEINLAKLVVSIVTIFTWFVGAIIYLLLFWRNSSNLEKIVAVIALFLPVIAGIILLLNAMRIIRLN